ncbi:MAG TPA: hypothetical protein VGC41_01745, partial [Kofleriaceae bacterium]
MAENPDDVMDRGPRAKRFVICVVVGLACAVAVYGLMYGLVRPDTVTTPSITTRSGQAGAYRFVWYITGLAFAIP